MRIIIFIGKKIFELISKISPKLSCTILYIFRTHELPHYKKPRNFNDYTTNLKLNNYNKNLLVSKCSDKYEVREYVKEKGLEKILNELYGLYDNPEQIDFSKLPNKFALKCTHGCAYNVICNNKKELNQKEITNKLTQFMNEKYGYATTEFHYTKIKPRIICEKYLCDDKGIMPIDYKIYCFNGTAKCILVCSERNSELKLSYYNLKWERINYEKEKWSSKKNIEKPKNLNKMIEYAEKLAKGFPFVRVDLYNEKGKIIFGELTFTPACCCAPYYNKEGNKELIKFFKGEKNERN